MKNFRISKPRELAHSEETQLTAIDSFPTLPAVPPTGNSKNASLYLASLARAVYQHGNTRNAEMRSPYPKGLMFISFPSLHSRRSLPTRRLEMVVGTPSPHHHSSFSRSDRQRVRSNPTTPNPRTANQPPAANRAKPTERNRTNAEDRDDRNAHHRGDRREHPRRGLHPHPQGRALRP